MVAQFLHKQVAQEGAGFLRSDRRGAAGANRREDGLAACGKGSVHSRRPDGGSGVDAIAVVSKKKKKQIWILLDMFTALVKHKTR